MNETGIVWAQLIKAHDTDRLEVTEMSSNLVNVQYQVGSTLFIRGMLSINESIYNGLNFQCCHQREQFQRCSPLQCGSKRT